MDYYLLLIQLFFALMGLFLFWKSIEYFRRMWQYKKLKAMPFPKEYKSILQNIQQYKMLSPLHQEKIHLLILIFIDQKEFVGAKMTVNNEIKVIIAFYACLMRLGFELGEKDHVSTVIVYPKHFIVNNDHTSGGIYHDERAVLEGQSANGTVVISWQDIKHSIAAQQKDNVIIHEFAHELDFEDGLADGTPTLKGSRYKIWSKIFSKAFDTLKAQYNNGEVSERSVLLGSYALTNEAEFFAVCSERFFETPEVFKAYFPNIYQELKLFYNLDTQELFKEFRQ
ncbi:MAG: M90 family metallopeptidase [Campylobacterota bacterium]|nr:M90 family metallopeptidase [Campylobacterota bacterium]